MRTNALQSREHRDLFDIIDKLRSQGISKYVDLPEIIVCGDQSSGKSSVLEAISGMSFPTKDNLCTRFATELILRRTPNTESSCNVSILPDSERTEDEKASLGKFAPVVDMETLDLGSVIEQAKTEMGLSETKRFSNDTLRVELSGPSQPHLTMVDLPGLFSAGNKDQSSSDARIVKRMVRQYMKRPRSIILAVVSAKNDFANQQVTTLTRAIDPDGLRTMGLITKPDTLHKGSDSEQFYLNLAQNRDVHFRLGWHILRNRDYPERDYSSEERNETERVFFSSGVWATLNPGQLGVAELQPRLSNVLREQILSQLPGLLKDVESGIKDCESRLKRLGDSRDTLPGQRRYLIRVSHDFSRLMDAAVSGNYMDLFFGDAMSDEGYAKRLRAVVQNILDDYSDAMRDRGQSLQIIDSDTHFDPDSGKISRDDYIKEVKELMRRSRGCELSGTFNPMIIGDLFVKQCQPWRALAEECQTNVLQATYNLINSILDEITAPETRAAILRKVNTGMESIKHRLAQKVEELLEPHYTGHPITYNHYLTDTVQRVQAERRDKELQQLVQSHTRTESRGIRSTDEQGLQKSLSGYMETNTDRYSSSQAIDYMEAYFKVASKRLVDNVGDLAIERCVMTAVPKLFDRDMVDELEEAEISLLADESPETSSERERNKTKLGVLRVGMDGLRALDRHQTDHSGSAFFSNEIYSEGEECSAASSAGVSRSASPIPEAPDDEAAEVAGKECDPEIISEKPTVHASWPQPAFNFDWSPSVSSKEKKKLRAQQAATNFGF